MAQDRNRYVSIIESIFKSKYKAGMLEVDFERAEFERYAKELNITLPLNLGDLIYTFRYRATLPESIQSTAGEGKVWIIRSTGRGKYRFALIEDKPLIPNPNMTVTKVPDSTPGIVTKYAFQDEQALLAKVRYSRLVDIFTGLTCYSLQNHLRTAVPEMGQVETDEIYIAVDKKGSHYAVPMQAKGAKGRLGIVQIEQDFAVCAHRFPTLICRPIAAQVMPGDVIALFEFAQDESGVGIYSERHYKLVSPDEVTDEDLKAYSRRTD